MKPKFTQTDIEQIYLDWMNETDNGSARKDRFLHSLENTPHEQQLEIEKWVVSSIALGLLIGYNKSQEEKLRLV